MNKRLLTLEDLYNYYSSNRKRSCHFSSKNENDNIVVQVKGNIKFEKSDSDSEGLMPVLLQSCHIGENLNGSNIDEDVMTNALPSFSNRPILGRMHEVDGQLEFSGHDMHLDENEEIVYDEIPIGIIPESCDAHLEYDEEKDKTYCVVKGYIFEEYTKAAEILQREEECPVSVELSIRELSYNAKEKYLNIENFFFSGVTILGKTEYGDDINPGMKGSNIKLSDFSRKNNSYFSLVEVLDRLDATLSTLSNFNINLNAEGKEDNQVTKFDELLEKYGKTKDDITFDYEGLTDEELEAAFAEAFGEEASEEEEEEQPELKEEEACGGKKKKKKCSITEEDGTVREFELSLDDVQSALYNLVNDTYSEADNTWYGVTVYDSYVIMCDWWNDKNYKQTYKREDDNFSLTGDRVEVFANWLTKDEEDSLAELRSNYSEVKSQLETYQKAEENEKKNKLFSSDEYVNISEEKEFENLKNNHSEFSYKDLVSKLDSMLLSYAKSSKFSFSTEKQSKGKVPFNTKDTSPEDTYKPYGDLFD